MKKTHGQRWGDMTAAELAEATREFESALPASRFKPLSKQERARFERARRAGARGRELAASLGIDPKLLGEAKAYAKRKKMTLSQLVERGLRRELAVKD